ncbi:MAG: glycerol-3-phosphate 1-O-acyltransferase PlsY [Candidatus Wallbacteria bacterium]|nr:glycerol-3-phosphate 1-O-acyltransferase PlsY [Candidatus Wallbacteria bacterium]
MEKLLLYLGCVLGCYLIGSIPFAYIVTMQVTGKDIRQIGSGNAGATNVYRACGMFWGVLVYILDAGKGWVAVKLTKLIITSETMTIVKPHLTISHEVVMLTIVVWVVVGHIFPVFLGFHGGKGVATACGMFIGLHAKAMEVTMVVWLVVTAVSRFVSLGTLTGAVLFPILTKVWKGPNDTNAIFFFSILCSLIVVTTHIPNIQRIIRGEELRIGERPD